MIFQTHKLSIINTRILLWDNKNLEHETNSRNFSAVQKSIPNSNRFTQECNIFHALSVGGGVRACMCLGTMDINGSNVDM